MLTLALLLAIVSLKGDGARARYVRERLSARLPNPECPPATVIVPVKGADEDLAANLLALAQLDYPDYELIVTARAPEDVPPGVVPESARIVHAGDGDPATGEKINNLLAAIAAARPESEVFAFADSDGSVSKQWLRALAAPLADTRNGVATGYRWHTPGDPAGLWSLVRSVWNSVIAGGFSGGNNHFAWGGAMAIRRETFERARVAEHWRGTVSDDFLISRAVHRAGLRIAFAPGAMVASADHTGAREFLGWIERQLIITRVYSPKLWWLGLVSHAIYCSAMAGALVAATPMRLVMLGAILACGMAKGAARAEWARLCLPAQERFFRRYQWIYSFLTPLGTWLWMYAFLASARTNTIRWRGYTIRLRAADEGRGRKIPESG